MTNTPTESREDWSKRFDYLCQVLFDASYSCSCGFCKDHKFYITIEDMKKIQDFIQKELEEARREVASEIYKLITPESYETPDRCFSTLAEIEDRLASFTKLPTKEEVKRV